MKINDIIEACTSKIIEILENHLKLSMCDVSTSTPTSIVLQNIDIDIGTDVSNCRCQCFMNFNKIFLKHHFFPLFYHKLFTLSFGQAIKFSFWLLFCIKCLQISWESNIEYICVRATLFIMWIKHLVLFLKHRHRHRTSIVLVNIDIDIASTQKSQHRTCLKILQFIL